MTVVATPQPANVPPRIRLDIDSDDAGAAFTVLEVKRDGTPIREQPFVGGPEALAFDYEAPFGVPVTYTAEGSYIPSATPDWTEAWASLAAWTGDPGDFSVAGGEASSSVVNADITRTTSGTIQRVDVTDPDLVRVELLTAGDVVVCSVAVTSNVVLTGTSSASAAGAGSFKVTLSDGVATAQAADASWSVSRPYVGTPTKVRIVSLARVPGTFIRNLGAPGSGAGTFDQPQGMAFDAANGFLYVADNGNDRIQKFEDQGAGVYEFVDEWTVPSYLFVPPLIRGITVDPAGDIWIVDSANGILRKYDPAGNQLVQYVGGAGVAPGQFNTAWGIAADASGDIFVTDMENDRVQKFDSSGIWLSEFGTSGSGDGQFANPRGIAIDAADAIFVADTSNNRIQKFSNAGAYQSKFGTPGSGNGQFNLPYWVTFDSTGNIFVADTYNYRVQKFNSGGAYLRKFGSVGTGPGQFVTMSGLAVDTNENLIYVADAGRDLIQVFSGDVDPASIGSVSATLVTTEQPFLTTVTTQLDVDEAWLIHPSQPSLSLAIDVGPSGNQTDAVTYVEASTNSEQSSRAERTLRRTVGRRKAVIFTHGPRQADEWTLVLGTTTTAAKDAIRALVDDQTPLLLRTPVAFDWDLPDDWYSVGDFSKNRQQDFSSSKRALSTLPLTPVDEPIVRQGAVWTWGDVLTTYDTWQDVLDAYDTWLDVLAGPSS